ncbi:DUF1499 domain-containing protein [Marinomonas pollencensis]|uniref:Uncharacterized protein (DUF1499 family) n=1 Tax=Marinomonas pollencensis TaxID=491954 RepID=A0A3E0DK25_9GAMM|nr:DUF1499 domain-containing protein [Marinomonas pollencensis]REG82982.1 uncharacterized protein (DUF1499 family) [Marinomonas pollencensis]
MVRWISLFVVVLVIGFFVYIKINNRPPEDLGVTAGVFNPCPTTPNCVSSQADKADAEHYIAPLIYRGSRKDTQLDIESYFLDQGNAKIVNSQLGYVHIEVASAWFGYIDDVEFYLPEADSVVHVRSASRVGYSDLDVNRQRIEKLKDHLKD